MGGWNATSQAHQSFTPRSIHAAPPPPLLPTHAVGIPLRHSCAPTVIPAPLPSFLRPPTVIPAQAGTTPHPPNTPSSPNSSLPPGRGEVRWGVGRHEPGPPVIRAPIHSRRSSPPPLSCPCRRYTSPSFPRPHRHSCAPPPSFLRRQEPRPSRPTPPPPLIHPSPLPGGRLGGGWGATSQAHQSFAPRSIHTAPPPPPLPTHAVGTPLRHSRAPHRHSRASHRHSCVGRNPDDLHAIIRDYNNTRASASTT